MDGNIARLESMEPIVDFAKDVSAVVGQETKYISTTQAQGEEVTTTATYKKRKHDDEVVTRTSDWSTLQTGLETFVGKEAAAQVTEFLQLNEAEEKASSNTSAVQQRFVELPPLTEKETRRTLHEWIKTNLAFAAAADTMNGHIIRIWHKSYASSMPNSLDNNRHKKRQPAGTSTPRDKPYLKFVLYKENMDTGAAMQQISKRASFAGGGGRGRGGRRGGNSNARIRMGYAGNKDKRGITSQFITIPARDTSIKHLCNVFNSNNTAAGSSGGGHTRAAGVGMIRIGNFQYCSTELRLGRLRGNRFDVALRNVVVTDDGNGSSSSAKTVLEQAAEAMRQTGFVNYFGTQRFGKFHDTHLTGIAVLRGDYEAAIDIIMRPKSDERDDIYSARKQWQERFQDLDSEAKVEDRAAAEKECAGTVLKSMNRFMQSEIAVLNSLLRYPLDYKNAFSCITKTMRMMFVHALQSYLWNKVASFRVEKLGLNVTKGDLVLTGKSTEDSCRSDSAGCPEVRVVTDEDVVARRYTLEDVVLPLIGLKTRHPENASGEHFDVVLKELSITLDMIKRLQDRDFHCAGDYRMLICRPTDIDFDIIEYKDELQPLLVTDYMKLSGIGIDRLEDSGKADGKDPLLAMVVGFSLPSSSYATIFLRELMKRPTSSEYQRELKLGVESLTDGDVENLASGDQDNLAGGNHDILADCET